MFMFTVQCTPRFQLRAKKKKYISLMHCQPHLPILRCEYASVTMFYTRTGHVCQLCISYLLYNVRMQFTFTVHTALIVIRTILFLSLCYASQQYCTLYSLYTCVILTPRKLCMVRWRYILPGVMYIDVAASAICRVCHV